MDGRFVIFAVMDDGKSKPNKKGAAGAFASDIGRCVLNWKMSR